MNIDLFMMWLGYSIIIGIGLCLCGFLGWLAYYIWDYWIKRTLGWKYLQVRKDVLYYINHKEDIQDYIKQKHTREK